MKTFFKRVTALMLVMLMTVGMAVTAFATDSSQLNETAQMTTSSDTEQEGTSDDEPVGVVDVGDPVIIGDTEEPTENTPEEPVSENTEPAEETEPEENTETEETPEAEFQAFTVSSTASGSNTAAVGETVNLSIELSRSDVAHTIQWQKLVEKEVGTEYTETKYKYDDGDLTWYSYVFADYKEYEYLKLYPNAVWPGCEMYHAIKSALGEAGLDNSKVSVAWKTPNFAIEGYSFLAKNIDGVDTIIVEKDGMEYTATVNADGEWEFCEEGKAAETAVWTNIPDANGLSYSFTVPEESYRTQYRAVVTITDEAYLKECEDILAESGVELTEEQKAEEQVLYSILFTVTEPAEEAESLPVLLFAKGGMSFKLMSTMLGATATGPSLSADGQWVENLNTSYSYITKDTYDRASAWLAAGEITQAQANLMWTRLRTGFGLDEQSDANILDGQGKPTGAFRTYAGQDLTNNALEVNSEWYGKTVYFRVYQTNQDWAEVGTAVDVPAYTGLTMGEDGSYLASESGTLYKEAITVLNPYPADVGPIYGQTLSDESGSDEKGFIKDASGSKTSLHITFNEIRADYFNKDPDRYLMDAEGNYRFDAVAWGVCCYDEPDLSGKAYWTLKDYLGKGYGMIIGHDTIYAYAGSYYDAYGTDLNESSIDPNDTNTWIYNLNTYAPAAVLANSETGLSQGGTTKSSTRGGHFYLNELVGSNAGNVYTNASATLADSISGIVSTGSSHGKYGKQAMYGDTQVEILKYGYSAADASANVKHRTPTNYPYYVQGSGAVISTLMTHTNGQAAFGTVWANYVANNLGVASIEGDEPDKSISWYIGDTKGTNNFYISGDGNFLMNQIGHLPSNSALIGERRLLINSCFYVSQRKQCEISAANQGGRQTSHFVIRVNSANKDKILSALQSGGTFWYPLDGCYMLTEDLTLPNDWTPISGFNGHWNSDIYSVTLGSNKQPLFKNTTAGGESGWNLGTDKTKGTENVLDASYENITGIARVVGDLNDLFGTDTNYAGYTVKILGSDNPSYMTSSEVYSCVVNGDSKYVISNLPCVYNTTTKTGALTARVYDKSGAEVTSYGSIRVNVEEEFWDNCETNPLYLGSFSVDPVYDETTYEADSAVFIGSTTVDEVATVVGWQYRTSSSGSWTTVPSSWGTVSNTNQITDGGDHLYLSTLTLTNVDPNWNGYEFRTVFTSSSHGTWNTYSYYLTGSRASDTYTAGCRTMDKTGPGKQGKLTVKTWPTYAEQSSDVTTWDGGEATFTAIGYALDDGTTLSATWQYSTTEWDSAKGKDVLVWHNIADDNEFGSTSATKIVTNDTPVLEYKADIVNKSKNSELLKTNAKFHSLTTHLTVKQVDIEQTGTHFRALFTAKSAKGTSYSFGSSIADELNFAWDTATKDFEGQAPLYYANHSNILTITMSPITVTYTPAANVAAAAVNEDTLTPDVYGQLLEINGTSVSGTAVYECIVYYRGDNTPTPTWQYRTLTDKTAKVWNTSVAQGLGYIGTTVSVVNSTPYDVTTGVYAGYKAIKSTMSISNVSTDMYNEENILKYYFRCAATTSYTTTKATKTTTRVAPEWGGLSMDYALAMQHNGVFRYKQKNIIGKTSSDGTAVTTLEEIKSVTDKQNSVYWRYPNLNLEVPSGRHVNTVIVWFDDSVTHNAKDEIAYDSSWASNHGITVNSVDSDKQSVTFVSTTKNAVETSTWVEFLQDYVSFRTFDNIDYADMTNVTGGAKIHWFVDEKRMTGVTFNPDSGKAYKVVNTSSEITWDAASTAAQTYDSETEMNGKLAEPLTAEENANIQKLLTQTAWIGGARTGNSWVWSSDNTVFDSYDSSISSYKNWGIRPSSTETDKTGVAMETNGTWNAYSPVSEVSVNIVNTVPDTAAPSLDAWGTAYDYFGGGYASSDTFQAYEGGTITATVNMKMGPLYKGGETGVWCSYAYQLIKVDSSGTETIVQEVPASNWYITGIAHAVAYALGSTAEYNLAISYTVPTGGDGQYYFKVETVVQRSADEAQAGRGVGQTTLKDITFTKIGTQKTSTDIRSYVVEYDIPSLSMSGSNHSADDYDWIGTKADPGSGDTGDTPTSGPKSITIMLDGAQKVYDKTALYPSLFEVNGSGATNDLVTLTIEDVTDTKFSGYATKSISGQNWQNTGVINTGKYKVTAKLTSAATAAGWTLSSDSVTSCYLIINARPITVTGQAYKIYDGTSAHIIGTTTSNLDGHTGKDSISVGNVVSGDTVTLNTYSVTVNFTSDGHTISYHSINNATSLYNGTYQYAKRLDSTCDLQVLHTGGSDPYHNYYIGEELYYGAIWQKGLTIHSEYDDYLTYPDKVSKPLNTKMYDRTTSATITNLMVEGVIDTDIVTVKETEIAGTYSSSSAGEDLVDGKVKTDRMKNLTEKTITRTGTLTLQGNDYNDYYIKTEKYSGAIYRASLTAQVKGGAFDYGTATKSIYGNNQTKPWTDSTYYANTAASNGCWLILDGLVTGDSIKINSRRSSFAMDISGHTSDFPTASTSVGTYPMTYTGLTQSNYDVLENYVVSVFNGAITISPQEIVVAVDDTDKNEGKDNPAFSVSFYKKDRKTGTETLLGTDAAKDFNYTTIVINSGNGDTVGGSLGIKATATSSIVDLKKTGETSNIPYETDCEKDSEPIWADLEDETTHKCLFCNNKEHRDVSGYEVRINKYSEDGAVIAAKSVTNMLGETVQNYKVTVRSGLLYVHPIVEIIAKLTGDSKVYDGTQLSIKDFSVEGVTPTIKLFDLTIEDISDEPHSGYTKTVINGEDFEDTGCINAGVYKVTAALTADAVADNWAIDYENSVLECVLTITQRPVTVTGQVYKIYDGTSAHVLGTTTADLDGNTGIDKVELGNVLTTDTVKLTTESIAVNFTSDGTTASFHNVDTATVKYGDTGLQYAVRNSSVCDLGISHTGGSDPNYNYRLGDETYYGAIWPRPLTIHSEYDDYKTYTEAGDEPLNVKVYDNTNTALITPLIIDNAVAADLTGTTPLGLNEVSLSGTYSSANSSEPKNTNTSDEHPTGVRAADYLENLGELVITASASPTLKNNTYGDYYIKTEKYSGAICDAPFTVKVMDRDLIYGTKTEDIYGNDQTAPWISDTALTASNTKDTDGYNGSAKFTGLVGTDALTLDAAKSKYMMVGQTGAYTNTDYVTEETHVGTYTMTYDGLTEANYSVLSNYYVTVKDGTFIIDQQKLVVTVNDSDKFAEKDNPHFYVTFFTKDESGNLVERGTDEYEGYDEIVLNENNGDTVDDVFGVEDSDGFVSLAQSATGLSNISFTTICNDASPVLYDTDATAEEDCPICANEQHLELDGYDVAITETYVDEPILTQATFTNAVGDDVQDYDVSYESGLLYVHPHKKVNLNLTTPMQMCLYIYEGDGDVIEPTDYGITNYTECDVRIEQIDVSDDCWDVVDKRQLDLKSGELTLNMNGTNLSTGANELDPLDRWIIPAATSDGTDVTPFTKLLSMTCYTAPGNVNKIDGCEHITDLTYRLKADLSSLPDPDLDKYVQIRYDLALNYTDGTSVTRTDADIDDYLITVQDRDKARDIFVQFFDKDAGTTVVSTAGITRPGYTLLGWSTAKNATVVAYTGGETVNFTDDTILYPVWAKS